MSKLTLDLNALSVESFAADDMAASFGMSGAETCGPNAVTPLSLTDRVCCEGAAVEACTVRNPCCDETP
jgi:hypothetical protein